jgi:hypothetical protein
LVENDGSFSDMDPFVGDSWSLTRWTILISWHSC